MYPSSNRLGKQFWVPKITLTVLSLCSKRWGRDTSRKKGTVNLWWWKMNVKETRWHRVEHSKSRSLLLPFAVDVVGWHAFSCKFVAPSLQRFSVTFKHITCSFDLSITFLFSLVFPLYPFSISCSSPLPFLCLHKILEESVSMHS